MLNDREIRMFFKLSDEEKREEMASYSNEELQQIIMAQSGAAAVSLNPNNVNQPVMEQLQEQLKSAQQQIEDLTKRLEVSEKERLEAFSQRADISLELTNLKNEIATIEAYEGEKFDDKVKRVGKLSGQDYYDDVVSKETGLTNYEKHDLVKAYVDDVDSISKPMIDFNTGKPIEHKSRVADFWKQHSDKQKNQVAPKTKEVAMDKQFNSFSDF